MEGVIARVPEDMKSEIEFFAKEEETDRSSMIRRLLKDALKRKRLEHALEKYRKREVSIGKAAEIAKMPLADFMMEAANRKIHINYTKEQLVKDFKAVFG